jgi:steroid 5-alpha reductase family enzyme
MTALTLLTTGAALLVLQGVTFVVALRVGKHSVMDTAWGIGIALTALTAFGVSLGHGDPARRALLLAASVLWGVRLAAYVGWRNHGKPEDPRYADMLRGRTNLYALRMVYLLQAAILWLATVPVQLGMLERSPAGPLVVIGALLFAVGFAFESIGDWQLARFKASATAGQIMDRGLWRYTRHPNYFGDFCMWWGLFAISVGSWRELPALAGPLLMSFILIRGTGARMTERRMAASRPRYADYVARTSGFIPLPPKRAPKRSAAAAAPRERA